MLVAGEPDHRERLADTAGFLGLADLRLPQAVADVAGDVHVREERVVLEHRVDVAPVRRDARDRLSGEQDLALGRLLEAGDHPQRRGLAAAGWSEEAVELAARDAQVHAVDGGDGPEPLRDVDDLDVRAGRIGRGTDALVLEAGGRAGGRAGGCCGLGAGAGCQGGGQRVSSGADDRR